MNELLTLAIAPGVLWAILVFLRVSGATLILSILVGALFADQLSQNFYDMANGIISVNDPRHIQLFLLILPVVLSIILTRSKTSASKILMNGVALLFASVTLILFALPYTDLSSKINETGQDIINSYQSYIVCATGGLALLLSWSPDLKLRPRRKHK